MVNLKIELSPEQFSELKTPDEKLDVIYSALVVQQKHCDEICICNDKRFTKLENRKKLDTGLASSLGLVGGFLAQWLKTVIGKS